MLYPALATLALLLLWTGFALRFRGPRRHAILMSSSMLIDLGLVLTLEFTRSAVGTALGGGLGPWQLAHVAVSSAAVVVYVPVFALGMIRLLRPSPENLPLQTWHRRLGYVAMALRTLGYVFMFSMVGR